MKHKSPAINGTATTLVDPGVPLEHKKALLGRICLDESPEGNAVLQSVLAAAANGNVDALAAKKLEEALAMIRELEQGALRRATYIGPLSPQRSGVARAEVMLPNGEPAYPVLADSTLAPRSGETVLVDSQCRVVLYQQPEDQTVGEIARFERRIGARCIEVTLNDHQPLVLRTSDLLREKLDAGEVEPGAKLLVCSKRAMAFDAVPEPDGLSHYQYLVRDAIPNVSLADLGSPPAFLFDVIEHVRREMLDPGLGRRYRQRRAITKLLAGVSGAGKTYSIQALWRELYLLMYEITGVPLDELPPRVLRLRMSQALSKWLGESDKNLDRFFTEVEQLAAEPFIAADGTRHELPVLVICEEIDGLARARGGDPIYDRIQTTALERLDMNCSKLAGSLAVMLFTTNLAHAVDPAFIRRAGGTIESFGRLPRKGFVSVLEKHLAGMPVVESCGGDQRERERRLLRHVSDWLYAANGREPPQVELTYIGSGTPVAFRRDAFLTAGLVDRAVQQAAHKACREEREGCAQPGVSPRLMCWAFDRQIRSLVDQLNEHNAHNYLTLPDGVRVASVRRIPQPAIAPYELETT